MLTRVVRTSSRGFRSFADAVVDVGRVRSGLVGAVGNTPLIKLESLSRETGCTILGKAEFLNPGGSVKDRAALYLIKDAEERGQSRAELPPRVLGAIYVDRRASQAGRYCRRGYRRKYRHWDCSYL